MDWTPQAVLALAPDAGSVKAARALATPARWSALGRDAGAVWGRCQGSGASAYQVRVALDGPVYGCSCPSRKTPCKHALALLLVFAAGDAVPPAEPPEWVAEWLEARGRRTARAQTRQGGPPDAEAQARRMSARERKVSAGAEEARRWVADLVRRGLADAQREPWRFWDEAAARMVDAQAGGLASRIRRVAGARAAGDAWPERVLEEAALLQLLLDAHARLDSLPEATRADVRQLIGWTVSADEVLSGERVRDEWAVIGQTTSEDERLRTQRTWLRGAESGLAALILAFGPIGQPLDAGVAFGTAVDASLVFYPGAVPLRALVAERHGEARALTRMPGDETVRGALAARAAQLARNPWLDRTPVALRGMRPARDGAGWALVDRDGAALRLARRIDAWELVSLSGGHPVDVCGELEGDAVTPIAVVADGRAVSLA